MEDEDAADGIAGLEKAGFRKSARGKQDMTLWSCNRLKDFESRIDALPDAAGEGQSLWIAWPKKSSGGQTELTQDDVLKMAQLSGLVDHKICAIDQT